MRFKKAYSSVLSVVRNIVSLNQKDLQDLKLNVLDREMRVF